MNKEIVVITGAGISVESGIQPFRGKSGIWEENPMEMATYHKFKNEPDQFLLWYYHRFVSSRDILPNDTHKLLAENNIRVITQNVDNLHKKAKHPHESLIEIHGNLNYKRKIKASRIEELMIADWDAISKENTLADLLDLFNISPEKGVDEKESYRPHVLLFDEFYTELYESEISLNWVNEADTIIFMGTSNSVGITAMTLDIAFNKNKNIIVVDPNPAESFRLDGVEIFKQPASEFCRKFFN
jgi:NAD-dependent deacetylase